ncbi:MAG: 16S rRNA (uracil(1498)-N(3))-methyltransferase [Actinobacteria bacterium]|nr:16S rRNA (uracil(1498)-N(3))-methyltransferase [Actinomycetota bacterium]
MPAAPARAHVFVADLDRPELSSSDRHHLERVLRLRPGDPVTVSDGRGRWRPCRFGPGATVDQPGETVQESRPQPQVTVAFALTKGERPEWTVQKLTELGVDRIVPFVAERSVVRWDVHRAATQSERWRRIAREAASQSCRTWLPDVEDIGTFAEVASRPGAALAAMDGRPPSLAHPLMLVGPEGGWSTGELATAAALPRIVLGSQVLRAETAAVTAGALLCALRLGVVAPAPEKT